MGPSALFDKSFLQALSVDEAVWFDHFFMPIIAPLFYVETLADLEKEMEHRSPEREVAIIASKFPEWSGSPTMFHGTLAINELLGYQVVMDGRPVVPGGRPVVKDGKRGHVFDESPESKAFSRWQDGKFLEIERGIAKDWRAQIRAMDLPAMAKQFRTVGIDHTRCKTLEAARDQAKEIVSSSSHPFEKMGLVFGVLQVPPPLQRQILERWNIAGYRPLTQYAPYTAHLLSVELFFRLALGAGHISEHRATNRIDVAYLNYLPFCHVFVSGDNLHRRTAPLFLRPDQEFVWAHDLKQDLAGINRYFLALPESQRNLGISRFARTPPKLEGRRVRALRAKFLAPDYDEMLERAPERPVDKEKDMKLIEEMNEWTRAPTAPDSDPGHEYDALQAMTLERRVKRVRGSWVQVPADMKDDDEEKS